MYLSHDAPCRLARLTFTLLMALAFVGMPQWAAQPMAAADITPPPNFTTVANRLDKVLTGIAEADEKLPRDTFDVDAVLKTTGNDPKAIFHWVRDQTRWIAYRGELRGPTGVLMDRMGNSLDRSLLLAEMLRRSGVTVRLVHATLDPEVAKTTLSRISTEPPVASPGDSGTYPPAGLDDSLARYSGQLGVPAAELRGALDSGQAAHQQLTEQALARTSDQTQLLSDLLAASGATAAPPLPPTTQPSASMEPAAVISNHFWVQQQIGKDQWTDLDPMLPDAEPGHAIATAHEAIPMPPGGPLTLPDGFHHLITLRVFVEQLAGDKREVKQVVSTVVHPADVIGQRIYFSNAPLQWPHDNSLFTAENPASTIKKLVLAQREFLPTIHIGDTSITAGSFDLHGVVNNKPDFSGLGVVGQSTVSAGNSTLNLLSNLDKPAAPAATQPVGTLISQWVEYEIQVPGQTPRKFRRDVFIQDGFKPGDNATTEPGLTTDEQLRRGLALLSSVEILVAPCQLSDNFILHQSATHVLAQKDIFLALLRDPDLLHRKTLADDLGKLPTVPAQLYQWAMLRCRLNRSAKDVCIASPTIATYVTAPALKPTGGLTTIPGFDLIDTPIALRPGSHVDASHVALEQGVLDTNLEALLVPGDGRPLNTAEMMAVSDAQNVDWVVVSDPSDARLAASGLSAQARARIVQDIAAGNRAVIPARAIRIADRVASGWWRVNPRTGQTLGMMENGGGDAIPGYGFLLAAVLGLTMAGITYAGCIGDGGSNAKVVGCIGCAVMAAALMAIAVFSVWAAPEVSLGIAIVLFTPASGGLCLAVSKMQ